MKIRLFLFSIMLLLIFGCQSIWQPNSLRLELEKLPSKNIVIVNIGEQNRAGIAKIIEKIVPTNPQVIGLDIFFKAKKTVLEDSLLKNAFGKCKRLIMIHKDSITADKMEIIAEGAPYQYFLNRNVQTGYAISFGTEKLLLSFSPFRTFGKLEKYHLSYLLASNYDSVAAEYYLNNFKESKHKIVPIVYRRDASLYPTVHHAELDSIDPGILEGKIVLLGYTGPTDEDKKHTPLRYLIGVENGPDTYGVYVVANIVEQILEEGRKIQTMKSQNHRGEKTK